MKRFTYWDGGGPPKEFKPMVLDNDIKEILGRRIEGLSSEFDGDAEKVLIQEDEGNDLSIQGNVHSL